MHLDWNEERTQLFRHLFPVESNASIAIMFSLSVRGVIRKARQLGLSKTKPAERIKREAYISHYYYLKSNSEIAAALGITRATVGRIAARLGLVKSKERMNELNARHRVNLVRQEKRRMLFGLEPVSLVKVVTDRRKISMRYRLKKKGYVQGDNHLLMYFTEDSKRNPRQEENASLMGFRFVPLPMENV